MPQLLILAFGLIIAWFFYPLLFGAVWQPASKAIIEKMLMMAEVSPSDVLYDLGSGDGRIVITASKGFGATAVGIEIDPLLVYISRMRIRKEGLEGKARIVCGNLFKNSIRGATVVTVFLRQGANNMLREKLKSELEKGSKVVSYVHRFEGWEPIKSDEESKIFLYLI
ncbi:MAG: SAM-dependent methyltransferase [Candidatus Bathyarchaeia archaeon]